MLKVKRKYVTDDDNQKVAVLVDIADFEKMEEVIENYGLYKMMKESEDSDTLSVEEAKAYYKKLKKAR